MRIVIAGGPRTGKTTLANELGHARHTDDLITSHEWSEASAEVARWFDVPGPYVIEGVATVRALRKWLRLHPEGKPCDKVIWRSHPLVDRTPEQAAMGKACGTIWIEILPELLKRGVVVT